MCYNETGTHKKRRIAIRGCSVAQQVHAQDLRASKSPPQASVKNHASYRSAKSRDVNSTGDFLNRYFVGVSARQQPHPSRSVGNTAPCLSRHGASVCMLIRWVSYLLSQCQCHQGRKGLSGTLFFSFLDMECIGN